MNVGSTLAAELQSAAAADDPPYPAGRFTGRGIVMCAGGARFFTCAWVAIGILRRHLGCKLPIEVWYLGPDEMGPPVRALLEAEGVHLVDAFRVATVHQASRFEGWELKTYAILHSRFQHVLLLDADNVPVADPRFLFDHPAYTATGALFWPDIVRIARTNPIWGLCGLDFRDAPAFESGQLVVDKSRCWRALQLAYWMNQRAEVFYDLLYGDKDSFLIAWLIREAPFSLIPHAPRQLQGTLCQRGPDGGVLFQHRYAAKWSLLGRNPSIEGFLLEPECRQLLRELAAAWDGHVFNPPPRSPVCRGVEAELVRQREFRWIERGDGETTIELNSDHRAGHGARFHFYWHVEDGTAGPTLVFHSMGLRYCALALEPDGVWRGEYLRPPFIPVMLVPLDPSQEVVPAEDPAGLVGLFEALLALYETLPWDGETMRDFTGAVRSLARLWPRASQALESAGSRVALSPARATLLKATLAELGEEGRRAEAVGHHPFASFEYDRL